MSDNAFTLTITAIIAAAILGLAALFLYAPVSQVDKFCLGQAVQRAVDSCSHEVEK
jgi:hypothetical protein